MYTRPALQIRAGHGSITASLWLLTAHIYHVMIIVTGGFTRNLFLLSFGEAAVRSYSSKQVLLEISQYSQENIYFDLVQKETLLVIPVKISKFFTNSFFYGTLPVAKKVCRSGQTMLFTH